MESQKSTLNLEDSISIIVPIYNTEKYIEKCIKSICEQTLENFEIVLIDDCSPDNAFEKAKNVLIKYPKRFENTQFIKLETNNGVAKARKLGFNNAQAKYITCLDSDDYIEKNALQRMLDEIKEKDADILVCDFFVDESNKQMLIKQPIENDFIANLLNGRLHGSFCNKIYKKELLEKVRILDDVNYCEDLIVAIQMGLITNNIVYLNQPFFHYIQYNDNSITKSFNTKTASDIMKVCDFLENLFREKGLWEKYETYLNNMKVRMKLSTLIFMKPNERKKHFDFFKDVVYITYSDQKQLTLYHKSLLFGARLKSNFIIDSILFMRKKVKKYL